MGRDSSETKSSLQTPETTSLIMELASVSAASLLNVDFGLGAENNTEETKKSLELQVYLFYIVSLDKYY